MQGSNPAEPYGAFVTVNYVRHRNVLVVRCDMSQLFTDYYLHLPITACTTPRSRTRFSRTRWRPSRCIAPPRP